MQDSVHRITRKNYRGINQYSKLKFITALNKFEQSFNYNCNRFDSKKL